MNTTPLPFDPANFANTEFVILDIETTGLDPHQGHCMVEFAAIKTKGKEIIGKYDQLINPGRMMDAEAEKITGISNSHIIMFGKPIAAVLPEIKDFIGNAILVGHNIKSFDAPFISKHMEDHSLGAIQNTLLDTLLLARESLNIGRYNLATLAGYFEIEQPHAHRAMIDVQTTMRVLWKLLELRSIS